MFLLIHSYNICIKSDVFILYMPFNLFYVHDWNSCKCIDNSFGHITLKLLSFAVAATCNIQSTDSFQHDNSCIIVAYVLSLMS